MTSTQVTKNENQLFAASDSPNCTIVSGDPPFLTSWTDPNGDSVSSSHAIVYHREKGLSW